MVKYSPVRVTEPNLLPWLIGLVLVVLVGFSYRVERRSPAC